VIVALIFGVSPTTRFSSRAIGQRLRQGAGAIDASPKRTSELLPVILTAALMIAGATLTAAVRSALPQRLVEQWRLR